MKETQKGGRKEAQRIFFVRQQLSQTLCLLEELLLGNDNSTRPKKLSVRPRE